MHGPHKLLYCQSALGTGKFFIRSEAKEEKTILEINVALLDDQYFSLNVRVVRVGCSAVLKKKTLKVKFNSYSVSAEVLFVNSNAAI